MASSPIAWSATRRAPIRTSKPRPPTSLASISSHRSMPSCSASMKRQPFRPWIAPIPSSRSRPGARSGTASSTCGMAPSRSTPPSKWPPGASKACTAATPHERRLPGVPRSSRGQPRPSESPSTSSSTICPPTRPKPSRRGSPTHPRVTMHYTPTYSSWLNQVESWFARIERDCIARGIFTSTTRSQEANCCSTSSCITTTCQPFVWRYRDPTRRMRATSNSTTSH